MATTKTNNEKERETINRRTSSTGAEQRYKEDIDKVEGKDTIDAKRATLNGKKGKIETGQTHPTGKTSALPGAEEKEVGTAAAGAGLGGNKGTGTGSKKNLD